MKEDVSTSSHRCHVRILSTVATNVDSSFLIYKLAQFVVPVQNKDSDGTIMVFLLNGK